MKIVSAEVFLLGSAGLVGPRNGPFVLMKLVSDDGVAGWGQAIHRGGELTARAAADLGGWLRELDAVSIEGVWQAFARRGAGRGTNGVQMAALSAVDIALHDLVGHALGVPISTLLGGRVRDEVNVYASFMGPPLEPAAEIDRVSATVDRGFRSVKLHSGSRTHRDDGPTSTVRVAEAVRDIWPSREDLQLILDVNNTFTVHEAIRVGRYLEELDVWWFEEPIASGDLIGYRKLQEALDLPVAVGEQEGSLAAFRDLITIAGIDILQPNLTACGGFTAGKKIAALAEVHNCPIACHNVDPSLTTAVHVQFACFAQMATLHQEYFSLDDRHPLRDETPVLASAFVPDAHGIIRVSDEPGLGMVVDEERVRASAIAVFA